MDEIRLDANESLDDHVAHLTFYFFHIEAVLAKLHPDGVERTFVAGGSLRVRVRFVIRIVLIDCVIGQMDKRVVESFLFVLFRRKSGKTVLKHENS